MVFPAVTVEEDTQRYYKYNGRCFVVVWSPEDESKVNCPCRGCALEDEDKNNQNCSRCSRRVKFFEWVERSCGGGRHGFRLRSAGRNDMVEEMEIVMPPMMSMFDFFIK